MYKTALNTNSYCQYCLPCGYCEKLGRDCPKQGYTYINPATVDAPATIATTATPATTGEIKLT